MIGFLINRKLHKFSQINLLLNYLFYDFHCNYSTLFRFLATDFTDSHGLNHSNHFNLWRNDWFF